jgi:hypothetical protein
MTATRFGVMRLKRDRARAMSWCGGAVDGGAGGAANVVTRGCGDRDAVDRSAVGAPRAVAMGVVASGSGIRARRVRRNGRQCRRCEARSLGVNDATRSSGCERRGSAESSRARDRLRVPRHAWLSIRFAAVGGGTIGESQSSDVLGQREPNNGLQLTSNRGVALLR